jgi:hypothetical protein
MAKVSNSSIIAGVSALLVAAFLLGWGVRTETHIGPSITVDHGALTPDSGIVINQLETGGLSPLGLEFGRRNNWVDVQMTAPPDCASVVAIGDAWPTSVTECRPGLDILGEVTGLGIAQSGESIIVIRSAVDEGCYEAIQPGDPWPAAACS